MQQMCNKCARQHSLYSRHTKSLLYSVSYLAQAYHSEVCICSQELRRGADPARIFSIAFSRGDIPEFVAVSSDKGTVHVFNLDPKRTAAIPSTDATSTHADGSSPKNPVSALKFVSVSFLLNMSASFHRFQSQCMTRLCMLSPPRAFAHNMTVHRLHLQSSFLLFLMCSCAHLCHKLHVHMKHCI